MKKVSVIIPMYNSEAFISRCVRSVLNQSYENLEVIIVDDGSADRSSDVCRELAGEDSRIRFCRQENGGVSRARNHGLEIASGDYVFFLDSDDAVHPLLLEEMMRLVETWGERGRQIALLFCNYEKVESGVLDEALAKTKEAEMTGKETGPLWQTAVGREAEKWFHLKHVKQMSGIGGKMLLREAVGELRFDENLVNGEDTLFLYQFLCRLSDSHAGAAWFDRGWYYYRMHSGSVTNSSRTAGGKRYFESCARIRDDVFRRGETDFAMTWEVILVDQIKRNYVARKRAGDREGCAEVKETAERERKHACFKGICYSDRFLFRCCFCCYPLYSILDRLIRMLSEGRKS